MNRTYMQKGIGAAPFAIVAALIVALTVGFWVTQPAQAAEGDVQVALATDIAAGTFVDPGDPTDHINYGPAGISAETGATVEASAADAKVVFRATAQSGAWVEIQADLENDPAVPVGGDVNPNSNAYNLQISIDGEASLSKSSTLTSATCASQADSNSLHVCQFAVWSTGNAGGFTVEASDAGGSSILTVDAVGKAGTLKGQFVGRAESARVLTAAPAKSAVNLDTDDSDTTPDVAIATLFGIVSPAAILSGTAPGLLADGDTGTDGNQPQAGFIFQLLDSAGQVALSTDPAEAATRDDLRIQVITDAGEDLTLVEGLSVPTGDAGATVYVDIGDESDLGTLYPTLVTTATGTPTTSDAGGLVVVGLTGVDPGDAALARIVLDLPGGGSVEHAVAIAGHPDADMSSVSAAGSPVNLGAGDSHKREVTLRDANGTPVPGSASVISAAETDAKDQDLILSAATAKTGAAGVYEITITANSVEADDVDTNTDGSIADDEVVGRRDTLTRNADVGFHAFSVTITQLGDSPEDVVKKEADANGDPIQAHVGGPIAGLSVTSVTNLAGDEILSNGEVTVGPYDLITITLTATDKDGNAPPNKSTVTPLAGTGFVGAGDAAANALETDDAGEVTVNYRAGTATQNLGFRSNGVGAQLLVRIVEPGAEVDTGPSTYNLVSSAVSTYVSWQGGDASSSDFENVAGLVIVWKWTGTMWVGYTSSPNAPAATKTDFALSDGDVLYVVSNGPVDITLD